MKPVDLYTDQVATRRPAQPPKNLDQSIPTITAINPNALCPCGSKLKAKRCCKTKLSAQKTILPLPKTYKLEDRRLRPSVNLKKYPLGVVPVIPTETLNESQTVQPE